MSTSEERRYLAAYGGALAGLLSAVVAFNAFVDPLQYLGRPTGRRPAYFSGYQRHQNVGLARSESYRAVVIGSSLTENFYPSFIEKVWGVPAVKLSISGSTAHEQRLILEQALRTGQVEHVLWGLDAPAFSGAADSVRDDQAPFPYFMYRSLPILNVEYFSSLDTLRFSRKALEGKGEVDLDRLDTWDTKFEFSRARTIQAWGGTCAMFREKYDRKTGAADLQRVEEMQRSVEENLASVVRAHPEVTFHLFFPPISVLAYVPARSALLPILVPFKGGVIDALSEAPNVRLHDFQRMPGVTDDLDHYKDPLHFDRAVSELVIGALHGGERRIQRADRDRAIAEVIDQANALDLCAGGLSTPR